MSITEVFDTKEAINERTKRTKLRVDVMRETIRNIEADAEKGRRSSLRECPTCYEFGKQAICGRGFTRYSCKRCGVAGMFTNTRIPKLCYACADMLNLCCRCGGDIDGKVRT